MSNEFLSCISHELRSISIRGAGQCFAGMVNNGWFTWMMVMLFDRVHRVVGRRAVLVDAGNSAVTDGAAIMPGYGSPDGYRLE